MTKKRWIVLAGMLAACVCLTLAVLALLPPRPGVTLANIDRIENGMTRAEIEKLLGGAGVELSDWVPLRTINAACVTVVAWDHPHDGTHVAVYFDRDNRVIGKDWKEWGPGPPETFLQKLQRLLHL
jgi:hypothetical protein